MPEQRYTFTLGGRLVAEYWPAFGDAPAYYWPVPDWCEPDGDHVPQDSDDHFEMVACHSHWWYAVAI